MEANEKFDLSIYYWLKNEVPSMVTVVDGFPTQELDLPTVSITNLDVKGEAFELGGCELNRYFWRIDIFAENVGQRDHLAYLLYRKLESNVIVYDYDEGIPSTTEIGTLVVSRRVLHPIRVFEDLVDKLYWRSSITFFTYYEQTI